MLHHAEGDDEKRDTSERKQSRTRRRIADKKSEDRVGRGALVNNRTRLDYGRHRRASVALASAVASNEVAANGPDMDEKLSRLNARARASTRPFFVITRSFKAPPGTDAIPTRLLLSGISLSPSFLSLLLLSTRLPDQPNSSHN